MMSDYQDNAPIIAIIANRISLCRRGNPSMSGPGPSDYVWAEKIMWDLELPETLGELRSWRGE